MKFLALNDDVKFIIANHLQSDRKIKKKFMNEPDDNLQKNVFGEVKEMTLDIEEVCMDIVNDNKKFKDEIEFLKKNYNKKHMGKYFYESYKELKIDAEFMISINFLKYKFL
jgi:hypothetical protein